MKEFTHEAKYLATELHAIIDALELGERPAEDFVRFTQKLEGILNASKNPQLHVNPSQRFAMQVITSVCDAGSALGHKASTLTDPTLTQLVGAFLAEALVFLEASIDALASNEALSFDSKQFKQLESRLEWISGKLHLTDEDHKSILKRFSGNQ